jgi:leader peptidase (prepilin peptidase)/N-methyltransferase
MSAVLFLFVFAIGACFGSFLNVCISRWPEELSVVSPPSRCPRCGNGIAWYDNIPIFSWLVLRAKCRHCALPISAVYPAVEVAIAVLWVLCFYAFGLTFLSLRVAIFATILFGIAITDAIHYLIPDGFTVTGLIFIGGASIAGAVYGANLPFSGPLDAMFGACVGAGAITIIGWLGEVVLKKEAMGFGDSTLMAMAGAALGPGRALLTIFVGALLATVAFLLLVYPIGMLRARRAKKEFEPPLVPFGVFLAPAALLTLLWGYPFLGWYLDQVSR